VQLGHQAREVVAHADVLDMGPQSGQLGLGAGGYQHRLLGLVEQR
jgi:hypothetical protein